MKKIILITYFFIFFSTFLFAQNALFNLDQYKNFLSSHQNLTCEELLSMYDIGKFEAQVKNFPSSILYLDSVDQKYQLTSPEKNLLQKHGFMVTERVSNIDFTQMFLEIYNKDLPVFISSDAILNAFHRSYDLILKGVEIRILVPKLKELLTSLHNNLPQLENRYSSDNRLNMMLKDVDLYISIPLKMLDENTQPYFADNLANFNKIINYISFLQPQADPIFGGACRRMDYNQFKPRGHYTDSRHPELAGYFKAMIWLGRTELYLFPPVSGDFCSPTDEDVRRQIIDSFLISELINSGGVQNLFYEIERTIKAFVGEQDNVEYDQFNSVCHDIGAYSASDFLQDEKFTTFKNTLATKPFSGQKILSQLLISDPFSPESIKPASAFLLFGQRFVIDSYIASSVTFDRIIYNNAKITRMLPSLLDVLFSLGNSAAAQLLENELGKYKYSTNLASLRFLIESYPPEFWDYSIYNLWLNSIRSLNPPTDRSNLPSFMKTAAWWQQKMNTQLSSWTELRHDNLLYAKQSYSGMVGCSFPYGYVEPVPEFYRSMKHLAQKTLEKLNTLAVNDLDRMQYYFSKFQSTMDTLETIAIKEIEGNEFSNLEKSFLKRVAYIYPVCGAVPDGWYPKLIYSDSEIGEANKNDLLVADYHTSGTDEFGNLVGWVKHAGTGRINLCTVVANLPGTGDVVFAGPVSSYYEYTTTNFLRLSDEDWQSSYLIKSFRPDWVNIYLANEKGEIKEAGSQLITDVNEENRNTSTIPTETIILQNFPNPFNSETTIHFTVPSELSNSLTELLIYNVNGELIKSLIKREIPSGHYLVRWNGTNEFNNTVSSGVYFYNLKIGNRQATGKMNLLK